MRELLSHVWRVKAAGLQFSRQDCVSVLLSLFVWMIQKSQQVCVFVDLKSKRKDTAFVRVCVCVYGWQYVCLLALMRQDLQSVKWSREVQTSAATHCNTHTPSHTPSLSALIFYSFSVFLSSPLFHSSSPSSVAYFPFFCCPSTSSTATVSLRRCFIPPLYLSG